MSTPADIPAGRLAVDAQIGDVLNSSLVNSAGRACRRGRRESDWPWPGRRLFAGCEAEDRHIRRLGPACGTHRNGCTQPRRRRRGPGPSRVAARPGFAAPAAPARSLDRRGRLLHGRLYDGRSRLCRMSAPPGAAAPRSAQEPAAPAEISGEQLRVVADDLARIEDVLRVKNPFHFAKTSNNGPAAGARTGCG